MPRDGVQRHRERVGQHRHLVGYRVGHREQHRLVSGQVLGETTRRDAQVGKGLTRRLVPRAAPLTDAARHAVHNGDARPVLELALDLVPEHDACRGASELLDVGAAEPTRPNPNELPGAVGLGQIGKLGQPIRVEDDRAHRPIVGGARSRARSSEPDRERDEPAECPDRR